MIKNDTLPKSTRTPSTTSNPNRMPPLATQNAQMTVSERERMERERLERERLAAGGEQRIELVEESLQVGKREVERGGVRVESRVVEREVEEQIALREEHVQVERHAVNRPVMPGDTAAFRAEKIELIEHGEEAMVAKQARVVEEVVIGKTSEQRVEQIRETLRHTEVSIDRFGGPMKNGSFRAFETYDNDFRNHYMTNYASAGGSYDSYAPLYRYGYGLATSQRFAGKDWNAVETEAKTAWEEKNPGTWEHVKSSIRHAWDRVTSKV